MIKLFKNILIKLFKPTKDIILNLNGYNLFISSNNGLIVSYNKFPNYGQELGRLAKLLSKNFPNYSVIDVGANIGDTCAIISSQSDFNIICFEGDEITFSYLLKNKYQFNDVMLYNSYLGEYDENVIVNYKKKGWNTTLIPIREGIATIEIKKLDNIWNRDFKDKAIKLLMIDTEGFDFKIIRGSLELIKFNLPVIYCEYNRENLDVLQENPLTTLMLLHELGYYRILYFDNYGRFLLAADMSNIELIENLHSYILHGAIKYYDICLFHKNDNNIVDEFIKIEKMQTLL